LKRVSSERFLPRGVSFERLCETLVGYLNAGAVGKYVGLSEVADKCSVNMTDISRNNRFFKSWGFIEEGPEKRQYKLVSEIAQFASVYRIDPKGDQSRQILKDFLSRNEIITKYIERIGKESLDKRAILTSLPTLTGDFRADKAGLNAFKDMLVYAFKLEELEVPVKRLTRPTKRIKRKHERVLAGLPTFYPPVILSVSPHIPLDKFKKLIQTFYEAYDEYIQKKAYEK